MENYRFDEDFDGFMEDFGSPQNCEPCNENIITQYQHKLPEQLFTYWRGVGWCGYHDGLYWMTNPKDYEKTLKTWLDGSEFEGRNDLSVIARNAFGKLEVWAKGKGNILTIDPNSMTIYYLPQADENNFTPQEENEDMRYFWGFKDIEGVDYEDKNEEPLFQRALEKFGSLENDEQYGYKFSPQLGGNELLDNMDKMNIYVYHSIAAQLDKPQFVSILLD